MKTETERLKKLIKSWGADMVAVCDLTREAEKSALPEEFQHFTRAISIAIHCRAHLDSGVKKTDQDDHQRMIDYINENQGITDKLNRILKKTAKELKNKGFKYFPLPPIHNAADRPFTATLYCLFPHRTAATSSGLGWIGKNGMLINGEYGPNLVWATILTNADLVASRPQLESMCAGCRMCEAACPVDAIKGINWNRARGNAEIVDLDTCMKYMSLNTEKYGRPVCGICFIACPVGARFTREPRKK